MKIACRQTFYLVPFLLWWVAKAAGQPKCKIEYYSTEHGLSHQRVTSILKDREGFMWFGSWDGINRFDGQAFVSYKSSPGDLSQLKNDRIDQIVEDGSGHLWILAYDNQVYRFDKRKEQFLPVSELLDPATGKRIGFSRILAAANGLVWLQSAGEGIFCLSQTRVGDGLFTQFKKGGAAGHQLPSNSVNFFYEDREHRIWIGTAGGVCCLTRSPSGDYKNSSTAAGGTNVIAWEEDAGRLYFGTADGNLILYDKTSKDFQTRRITTGRLNALLRSKKRDVLYATTSRGELAAINLQDLLTDVYAYSTAEPLHGLYEDQRGYMWIEPDKLGVIRFDPSGRSFQSFSQKNEEGFNSIGNRFRVLEDNNGLVWINMKGGGFGSFDRDKQAMDYFISTPDAAHLRLPKIIYTIYYDRAGILWLTTYERELIKIVLQGNDFNQQLLVEQSASISDNEVRGVLYDRKNRLWLGSKSGKTSVYQDGHPLTGLFENEPKEGLGLVYSMLQDSRGNIWLGTKGNGLYKASPTNSGETRYHLTHFLPDHGDSNSLPCKEIYSLLEDKLGRIWIGSFDNGLSQVQDNGYATRFMHAGSRFHNYPKEAYKRIRHMELDARGNMWIGTTDGLLLLDPKHPQAPAGYAAYHKIPGDKESLGNNDIQFIYRDYKNRMWVATSGGGFCQAVGQQPFRSLRFRNYTTRDGMPNDYVLSCAGDRQGNLWLATENGLARFNPEQQVFRNYDAYDGLPKASFSEAAVSRRPADGQLVFGATKGFLTFDPARIGKNRAAVGIALTHLRINNEDAGPGGDSGVLKNGINYVSALTLKHNQNIISIDYAMLDHRAGNRQAFAYRLVGFDSAWHDDRQQRRATYTNLPPGGYTFEVRSPSSDLYLNTPYRRLAITILPPPWKTWWAYLLYAVLLGVILFFIRRTALAIIRLRNKIAVEQKLAALKLKFFTNVSHELRTPLTLIINPLEQLYRKEKLSPEGASLVEVAHKNATRMMRFINQLLDVRKVQSGKATLRISRVEMVLFVKKITDHFTEAARDKGIKLEVSAEQKELIAWVDAEKLEVVIYNLLSNALKFTPEGKSIRIMLRSVPEEHSFLLAVYDQGPGVKKDQLEALFELFHQGDQPTGREPKGTGIGLSVSREFVQLHGGKIWAANNADGGLTVTLQLKLGSGHFTGGEVSFVDAPKTPAPPEKRIEQQLLGRPVHQAAPKDPQAPLVLLVEDNDELRAFLAGQLSEFYRVETAADGEEGWQKAGEFIPDLVISDIMMPRMDGIRLLDKIKNSVDTSHIPVVLLSAKYSIESQIEGLQYGADCYITKPFNNEFLIASVDNLLRQRKKMFDALVEKKRPVALSPGPLVITSKDEVFLKGVIKVVETKMADFDFNIDAVAESMAMSRTTFYKKFKSLTSLTPVEFVRDMRLQRAKQYLDAGSGNVSEVAYQVGFNNPKYFSTCFKEKYHVSPSDYVKS